MMENRDSLRNLLIAGAVFIFVVAVGPKLIRLPPPPERAAETSGQDAGTSAVASREGAAPGTQPPDDRAGRGALLQDDRTGMNAGGFSIIEAEAAQTRAIGSEEFTENGEQATVSPYRMRLTLSSIGAAVESATITDHAEELGSDARYALLSTVTHGDTETFRSLAIERINIDDVDLVLFDKKWHAGPVTETEEGQTVEFWIEIHQDGVPALKVTRTFNLPRQERKLGRHDLRADIAVANLSPQPHKVIVTYRGGLGVRLSPGARMDDRFIDWGIHDGTRVVGTRQTHSALAKKAGEAFQLYAPSRTEPNAKLSWAATANTYFTCTVAPRPRGAGEHANHLADVTAVDLDGSEFTDDDITVRFVTTAQSVEPGGALTFPADIYLGVKDGGAFRGVPEYLRRNYYYQISQGFGICTFSFLVELMIWLLNSLFAITRDYGLAIIVLVLIVRTLLHPITKKGQVNMVRMQHRMQEMAPKIEEIKKKYSNDKARMNQEMMKLNINPAGQLVTCLPMMLQMPIWIALFLSLSNNIQMRHQPFHFTWINDLTAADAMFTFPSPITIPLVGWVLPTFNLLPLLVSLFMYTQMKLQPKPKPNPSQTDQQRQQQEMMQKMGPMMSIMMLVFFYKMPSGLNLYIMCSSLFGTIEQYYIRKHIKEREEAGTLHKPRTKTSEGIAGPKSPGKASFFERLQKMADQAQKAQPQSQRTRKRKVRR